MCVGLWTWNPALQHLRLRDGCTKKEVFKPQNDLSFLMLKQPTKVYNYRADNFGPYPNEVT